MSDDEKPLKEEVLSQKPRPSKEDVSFDLSFKEARMLMKNNDSLIAVKEKRHFVLDWSTWNEHLDMIVKIAEKSVGNYNRNVRGIPIAIGKIKVEKDYYLVEDGRKIHIDAVIPQIVFRPRKGAVYVCDVTSVDSKFCNGFLFNKIAVSLVSIGKLNLIPEKAGGRVNFRFSNIQVKGSICQIRGQLVANLLRQLESDEKRELKKRKKTFADSEEETEEKPQIDDLMVEPEPKEKKKKKRHAPSESEEETAPKKKHRKSAREEEISAEVKPEPDDE
uniref:DNA-directed RNA polymerase I subunit RPA43 n=1 Tax=Steinernema glaseri TaxID=37863 RepID=A0A1I7ZX75_9BILA